MPRISTRIALENVNATSIYISSDVDTEHRNFAKCSACTRGKSQHAVVDNDCPINFISRVIRGYNSCGIANDIIERRALGIYRSTLTKKRPAKYRKHPPINQMPVRVYLIDVLLDHNAVSTKIGERLILRRKLSCLD